MSRYVYILTHTDVQRPGLEVDTTKLLGIFATEEKARKAINFYTPLPGFKDSGLASFSIERQPLGRCTGWVGGFGYNAEGTLLEMPRAIDKKTFLSTMCEPMRDVTESAEGIVNIWPYAEALHMAGDLSREAFDGRFVEAVYESGDRRYHHVLLDGGRADYYAVIVIDVQDACILGHHMLDMAAEYGANE